MKEDEKSGDLVFESTGRRLYMPMPQIGIDPRNLGIVCGYDACPQIEDGDDDRDPAPLSRQERRELADYVIALWNGYADQPD